ncbi:MAG: PA2778 family cysteine peptidase [Porticoccaceae bacterium]|jgi:tetratricopeptide (TPR) repeat protein|nr:PA2778 family cysteine peptidase [Porticoccaceae bacterium]MEA3300572.1 PA2778 family cysteine peptidase [Pseudomonadota bacterium]
MRPFRPRGLALAALLLMLSILAGCGATPHSDRLLAGPSADLPPRHELTEVPFHPQEAYQCGPAALATVLQHSGVDTSPEALEPRIYVPGRQGSFQVEILAATRRAGRLAHLIAPDLEALLRAVAAGQPVLVLQNLGLDWYPQWHYAVVVGYDLAKRQVVLRSGVTERYHMPLKLFERTWRRGELWGMVALAPGELPVDDDGKGYFLSAAAFERSASPDQAGKAWRAGVARWPRNVPLLMGDGNFRYGQGDYSGAEARFRAATEQDPSYAPAHNNLAQALLAQGRFDAAAGAARRAVELGGAHVDAYRATLEAAEAGNPGR